MTATATARRPLPGGINKSIKIWSKVLFTGYLGIEMWFLFGTVRWVNDGTIFDRVRLVQQLATLQPQIQEPVQINVQHSHTYTIHAPNIHPHAPPYTSCFCQTLSNGQTGPVCMSSTCCVSALQTPLRVKLDRFQ